MACHYMQPNELNVFAKYLHYLSNFLYCHLEQPNGQHYHDLLPLFILRVKHIIFCNKYQQHLLVCVPFCLVDLIQDHFFIKLINKVANKENHENTYDVILYYQMNPLNTLIYLLKVNMEQIYHTHFLLPNRCVLQLSFFCFLKVNYYSCFIYSCAGYAETIRF